MTDGQMEKLKVDQCKVYLRKYGLRLTGKKDTLIGRIREHLEYVNFNITIISFTINLRICWKVSVCVPCPIADGWSPKEHIIWSHNVESTIFD